MTGRPDYSLESAALAAGAPDMRVCGVDEAGRGPIAGPVVAAAVILNAARIPSGIDDSKRLSPARRETLAGEIRLAALAGFGLADVAEIDRLNILGATLLAMRRAILDLPITPALALIDGNRLPSRNGIACSFQSVVGGDRRSLSIAAASILAKTRRDSILRDLAQTHPGYGWERNAGYPTAEHRNALARLGPTPHHRTSFMPVRAMVDALRK